MREKGEKKKSPSCPFHASVDALRGKGGGKREKKACPMNHGARI